MLLTMSRQQIWQHNNNKKTHCACDYLCVCVCAWKENWGNGDSDNGNNHNTSKDINNAVCMCVGGCTGEMETNELEFQ